MPPIVISEGALLLIMLMIENMLANVINSVSEMSPTQIETQTSIEKARKHQLMEEMRNN